MGRKKIAMEKIENETKRQVTFSKRHKGVIKKAKELATLTGCEILLIIFSSTGKLCKYTNKSVAYITEKYRKATEGSESLEIERRNDDELVMQQNESEDLALQLRRLLGEELENLNLEELRELEQKLEVAISRIRAKREGWVFDYMEKKFLAHHCTGTPFQQLHQDTAINTGSQVPDPEEAHDLCILGAR
ncbi:hypothetical protein SUGI_0527120 [Cryptomeria japonica]|uniref:floral homeotic protein AGAMOUS n=1 Tax=Cryptomeria japonica TaxID=3369 RepID=UPI002408E4A4|nr:floral homeotic protein AGAMOUS [Cryptomeria japonica]GLJ26932.1 hypothetical protein SUGI_0527120 [Cryptomeria japonica]